ncbi:MAG: amino-acid N-acetyltransferase [Candidatus Nanopelagicales bacterium]
MTDTAHAIIVRTARTADVAAIRALIGTYTDDGRLMAKAQVTLFESVQEFVVAESNGQIVGCGALHVMWEDLAEVRSLAVEPRVQSQGVGSAMLTTLLERARSLGVRRVFCLTFETSFFSRHGFGEIDSAPVSHAVFEELLQSYDQGVAEFLDLERVKPNTLGNHRMLLRL